MSPPAREDVLNLANLLTLVRLGSIPVLVTLLYFPNPGTALVAGVVFFAAGLTDLLDGIAARRLKKVTVLGTFLDPMADKLLVASVLVMLVTLGRAPAWMAVVIICREIAVTVLRAVATSQGFTIPSDLWGKFKTGIQMLALWLLIFHYPFGGMDLQSWGTWALWASMLLTAYSGLLYFLRFMRRLNQGQPAD